MGLRMFVDFDGTVTREDVGNAFFRTFGGPVCDESIRAYREGSISATECFTREAAAVGAFKRDEALGFFRDREIDPTFPHLLGYAQQSGIELTILSDGLDLYIREILDANGLTGIPFFANEGSFRPARVPGEVTLGLSFPYQDQECTRCACCKRNIMLTQSSEKDIILLVGEGYSDRCPARYADVVFAKADLQTYCQRENISYFPYQSFRDVVSHLEKAMGSGRPFRKRTRAELNRQEAFRTE